MNDVHLLEVSLLAARVARRLGGSPSQALRCRLAGLLHDVGKVRVPSAILMTSTALDEHGWALMREHSAHGEALVCAVPDLRPIAAIVRHHHERWDGSGYPGTRRNSHPARGPDHRGRRRMERDDDHPALPRSDDRGRRAD
jgi:HD-GYP domain-containing protein (c-di-GMP phosphodiesterase class II)